MGKLYTFIISSVLCFSMMSCGSDSSKKIPESVDIKISESEVYGDNSELFSVVSGSYKLKCDDRIKIKVTLKLEKQVEDEIDNVYGPELRLKDEDGMSIVDEYLQMSLADGEDDKLVSFLKKEPGTEMSFVFVNDFSYDYAKDVMTKANGFSIENLDINFKNEKDEDMKAIEDGLNTLGKTMDMMDGIMESSDKMMDANKKAIEILKDIDDMYN